MDSTEVQIFKTRCNSDASFMTEHEGSVVGDVLVKYFLPFINVSKIIDFFISRGYLSDEANCLYASKGRIIERHEFEFHRRVLLYLRTRVGFVTLLKALYDSGYTKIVCCLLIALDEKLRSENAMPSVSKLRPTAYQSLYKLTTQLKYVSDTRVCGDPTPLLRKLAVLTKEKYLSIPDGQRKLYYADKYFAVLSVEIDNSTYLQNKYVTLSALQNEARRIIPFTSNPTVHEALFLGQCAEDRCINGKQSECNELMQAVLTTFHNTVTCPETGKAFYTYLNVLLMDYQRFPCRFKKSNFLSVGYEGLRLISQLPEAEQTVLRIVFMQRMIMCALDVGLDGGPIKTESGSTSLSIAAHLLEEIRPYVTKLGLRRQMLFALSMGRLKHLTGNSESAFTHVREAERIAEECSFDELENIREYKKTLRL